MKKLLAVIIALVILLTVIVTVILSRKDTLREDKSVEDFIPADTLLYISQKEIASSWDSFKNSDFWEELVSSSLWIETIEPQLATLVSELEEKTGFIPEEVILKELFGKEIVFVVLPDEKGTGNIPRVLLITQVSMQTKVKEYLVKTHSKLAGDIQLRQEKYKTVNITNLPVAEGINLSYAFLGNWLAVTAGKDNLTLKESIDLYLNKSKEISLKTNEEFLTIRAKLPEERSGLFYLNTEKLPEVLAKVIDYNAGKGNLPQPQLEEIKRQLAVSLTMYKAYGGVTWIDEGLKGKYYFLLNREAADETLLKMYSWEPRQMENLQYIPKGTVIYASGVIGDISIYWEYMRKVFERQNPQFGQAISEGIENMKTEWDISLEDDLFSWMGNEFAYAFTGLKLGGMVPQPGYFIMLKVKDEEKAQETLTKLEGVLSNKAEEKGLPFSLNFADENHEGQKIRRLNLPMLSPGYAFLDNFLVVSLNISTIKELIEVKKNGTNSLTSDINFCKVKPIFSPETNGIGYVNIEEALTITRNVTGWLLSMQEMQLGMMAGRKANLELREFDTPEEKAQALKSLQNEKEQLEEKIKILQDNLEDKVYPLLESLKIFKSIGTNSITDTEGTEEYFHLVVEE